MLKLKRMYVEIESDTRLPTALTKSKGPFVGELTHHKSTHLTQLFAGPDNCPWRSSLESFLITLDPQYTTFLSPPPKLWQEISFTSKHAESVIKARLFVFYTEYPFTLKIYLSFLH
jgi:hypothetical protein